MAATTVQQQRNVVIACYLGWTLDAFDFFIMVFVFEEIAKEFNTTVPVVSWAIQVTLAMRMIGAYIFGRLADRFGRRPTLMADVLCYSVLEFLTGFSPNLTIFIILRALYGIAMGGEWGVGASLTMESIPAKWRGWVSGLLQAGYPSGFLLASLLYFVFFPLVGWRGLFMLGATPALLVLYIRRSVPESEDWQHRQAQAHRPSIVEVIRAHIPLTIYAVVMMTAFNFFSHGSQDQYPLFLKAQHHLGRGTVTTITVVLNIGAMLGGIGFGFLSQRIGRRAAIVIAAMLALPVIPLWAFSTEPLWLGLGAFLMQICVQGAWGVIPAHLNELSPPDIRGTFPGTVYQLGNFVASVNSPIQTYWAASLGGIYSVPLAWTVGIVAVVIGVLVGFGREGRDVRMGREQLAAEVPAE